MSHTTKIAGPAIKNAQILALAVASLGAHGIRCSLEENVKPRAYSSNQKGMEVAPYVLRLPDATYDVGFYLMPDGTLEPRTDFYNGSVARLLGAKPVPGTTDDQANLGKLFQHYQVQAAMQKARQDGYEARLLPVAADGSLKIKVTGFATA